LFYKGWTLSIHDTAAIFSKILTRVKAKDPVNSRKWFDDLVVIQFDGGHLEVGAPDESKAEFLKDNCHSNFTQAAQGITGHLVSVDFSVAKPIEKKSSSPRPKPQFKLHPDYTFENFVVGPCNRLAHASCIAAGKAPGSAYNPLFLYGNVGLGKTHLQHAICHEAKELISDVQIQFLSCEEFVNHFINAIEQGKLPEFQNKYRNIDILVIDDVQFLRGKEHTQEEFFHTFNALYNNGKQIVLTSDSPPSELAGLEERLISRFKWGLVARIDAPTYETRVAIVRKKAHLRGLQISEEIAEYIANKVKANIRELEGALTVIYATAQTCNEPITLSLAKQALGDHDIASQKNISMSEIINAVTEYFGVKLTDLQSKKRSQSIALPRQLCMYLARDLTRHSLEEIGGHLGGRDHTTVMHACGKINGLIENDPEISSQVNQLKKTIKQD
jgi:chromosomal replication initiator protein